ncbi:MAG: hypothetical protein JO290_01090 [Sphingomonadaceae bacterium]|nr:hypothetical protein [Sphingomonadaceae bacterium]
MIELYLAQANRAVAHVREKLPRGSSNQAHSTKLAGTELNKARGEAFELIGQGALHTGKMIASTAFTAGAGNCGEQVYVAFEYLKKLGVSPLDIFAYGPHTGRDHAWLVIGRPAAAATRYIDDGWDDAVLCDPWYDFVGGAVANDDFYGNARFILKERYTRRVTADF